MKLEQLLKEFDKRFIPASLKWKDAIHCTCCTTEKDLKGIRKLIKKAYSAGIEQGRKEKDYQAEKVLESLHELAMGQRLTVFFQGDGKKLKEHGTTVERVANPLSFTK